MSKSDKSSNSGSYHTAATDDNREDTQNEELQEMSRANIQEIIGYLEQCLSLNNTDRQHLYTLYNSLVIIHII